MGKAPLFCNLMEKRKLPPDEGIITGGFWGRRDKEI